MNKPSSRRKPTGALGAKQQSGFTLLQVLLGVALSATLLSASLNSTIEGAEEKLADAAVLQLFTVGDTAQLYRRREGQFPDAANNCANAIQTMIDDGYLAGFPQRGGVFVSAWRSPITTTCVGERFDATNDARELRWAQYMARQLGAAAIAGNTITTSFSGLGLSGAPDGRFLFRVAVPGEPERNQMETDLDMNGNEIIGVGDFTANQGNFQSITANQADLNNINAQNVNVATRLNMQDGSRVDLGNGVIVEGGANNIFDIGNNGTIRATDPGSRMETRSLRWGPNVLGGQYSELTEANGGIELGGRNGLPGFSQGQIDFHFPGVADPDFNSRIVADANGQLSIETGLARVSNDLLVQGSQRINRDLGVGEVVLENPLNPAQSRRLSSYLSDALIVDISANPALNRVTKPVCTGTPDNPVLTPRIFVTPAWFAQGALSKPIAQVRATAIDFSPTQWEVGLTVLTEDGQQVPEAGFGKVQVIVQCG